MFAQKWNLILVVKGTNSYVLENMGSNRCLAASDDGTVFHGTVFDVANSGQHRVPSYSSGRVMLSNVPTGLVLAALGNSLGLVSETGTESQEFQLDATNPLPDGTYRIHESANVSMMIDLSNESDENGTAVQVFSNNGSAAQIRDVRENQDGTYEISIVLNGKVLDVVNGAAYDGAPIQLWQRNGSAA